jgi:hypothetical protein
MTKQAQVQAVVEAVWSASSPRDKEQILPLRSRVSRPQVCNYKNVVL